ncbi:hypothetical protein ACPCTO_35460 [Streptomyces olivoreticuli]
MGDLERIITRRSELDELAEELTKRLQEVQAEREFTVGAAVRRPVGGMAVLAGTPSEREAGEPAALCGAGSRRTPVEPPARARP